jgi:NhaP-type Na+/H+ or K+/H+ antiporter
MESGMNDAVLLPIVVIATLALQAAPTREQLEHHLIGLFLLGPALGAAIGWVGIRLLAAVRSSVGVRRDYESLYALGLGFTSFAAAEVVGGSGFLAAFAAGLAIAALDVELCDCFLEYGEATAEMLLLLTFVAFGTSLIWTGLGEIRPSTIAFAAIALGVRSVVLFPVLGLIGVRGTDRRLISLFGPRGLSSLLLVLLPVFAGVPDSGALFTITSLVVLLSLIVHGGVIGVSMRTHRHATAVATSQARALDDERITLEAARELEVRGEPVVWVDARAPRSFSVDPRRLIGSVRLPPDDPVRAAEELRLDQRATIAVYCA